jgi:hypothetical protein
MYDQHHLLLVRLIEILAPHCSTGWNNAELPVRNPYIYLYIYIYIYIYIFFFFFFIMYFSLPKDIPPRPLGGKRVRKHWSAVIYAVITVVTHCIIVISYIYISFVKKKSHSARSYQLKHIS